MRSGLDVLLGQADLRAGDRVLIVTDTRSDTEVGRRIFHAALDRHADPTWSVVSARSWNGQDLPEPLVAALPHTDLAVLVTSWSATHSPGVISAVSAGARVLSMPGVRAEMLDQGAMTADYDQVAELTERWAELFARGRKARLTGVGGTDLVADIGGPARASFLDDGRLPRGVGSVINMPAGEVAIAPVEATASGCVVADLTVSTTPEPVRDPVQIQIAAGKAVNVTGGREADDLQAALEAHGDGAHVVAEIALGTNPAALHIGVVIEDEKALGTAHVGFGHSIGLGGTNASTVHLDAILSRATLQIDGLTLLSEGVVCGRALRRESLSDLEGRSGRFRRTTIPTKIHQGRLFAGWRDVRDNERWAQVGDEDAAAAAARFLTTGRLEPDGIREARIAALLERYSVIEPGAQV
jgi:leucyl aminopeptidase (aminopeptidase T)